MRLAFLLTLFMNSTLWASPKQLEVWFLSPSHYKKSSLDIIKKSKLYAQKKACQKVGDYCFDPQRGLYKESSDGDIEMVDTEKVIDEDDKRELLKGTDTDLVHCDRDLYFDVFCGKSQESESKKAKVEIWVDVSSSLRKIDGHDLGKDCYRKSFVKRLKHHCEESVHIKIFNTTLKSMGSLDTLCHTVGLNDQERIIKWIKNSKAQKLILITDIFELTKELADYAFEINGELKGDNAASPMIASDLLERVDDIAKVCTEK